MIVALSSGSSLPPPTPTNHNPIRPYPTHVPAPQGTQLVPTYPTHMPAPQATPLVPNPLTLPHPKPTPLVGTPSTHARTPSYPTRPYPAYPKPPHSNHSLRGYGVSWAGHVEMDTLQYRLAVIRF